MRCPCCGQKTKNRTALPVSEVRTDWLEQATAVCFSCGGFIYRIDTNSDWLHLGTDARKCGDDAESV